MVVDNFILDSKIDIYGYIGTFIILTCLIINTIRKSNWIIRYTNKNDTFCYDVLNKNYPISKDDGFLKT